MESYSVQAVLSVSDKGFAKKMSGAVDAVSDLDSESKRASSSIMGIAKGIGVFKALSVAGNTLKSSLDGAINRFDTMNKFPKVMEQIGFSTKDADASIQKLSDGIQGLPTTLDGIAASTQNIAVLTRDLDKATDTTIALNDAFLASGAASADAERGMTQYVQMLSKGTVDMQSWKTLQETMGPALYDLAEAFGFAGESAQNNLYDALQTGEITFNQFNDKLIELDGGVNGFAERARTASGGIKTSFANMGTSVVRGTESVIRAVDDSLTAAKLPNFEESLQLTTTAINNFFSVASEGAGTFVNTVAPAVKLVGDNLDTLVPVLGTATAGFVAYKAAMDISKKYKVLRSSMAEAVERINAVKNATQLATAATTAQEKAIHAAEVAETLNARSVSTSEAAIKAETAAKELSVEATKAQKVADQAASAELKVRAAEEALATAQIKVREAEEKATAAQTKIRTAEEKLATAQTKVRAAEEALAAAQTKGKAAAEKAAIQVTKAQSAVEKAAAQVTKAHTAADKAAETVTKKKAIADQAAIKAEEKKAAAVKFGASAEQLNTIAEMKGTAAAKAQASADAKAAAAKKAKTVSDRAETMASTLNTAAETANTAATQTGAKAAEISSIAIATKTALLGVLSGKLGIVAAAQMVWNTAMTANPIGTVITASAALITVLVGLTKAASKLSSVQNSFDERQKKLKKSTDELIDSLVENKSAYIETYRNAKSNASVVDTLVDKVVKLSKKENKSASDKALLASQVAALNKSMDGLNLQYDEESDKLNMTTAALKNKAKAYKEQALSEIYAERYKEVLEEQLAIEAKLAESKKLLKEAQEKVNNAAATGDATIAVYTSKLYEQQKATESLEKKKQSLAKDEAELTTQMAENQEKLTKTMQENQALQAEAVEASAEAQKISFEELTEAQEAALERITGAYETMTGGLSELSKKIEEDSETTWAKVQQNQKDTIAKTQEFASLYSQAINSGVSESYLKAIGATGPEALPLLRSMMSSGIDEVLASQGQWEDAYKSIGSTFTDSFKLGGEEKAAIQEYILGESGVFGSLQSAIEAADFASIGKAVPEGTAEGITSNAEQVNGSVGAMTDGMMKTAQTTLGIHSPSTVFRGYGENTIQGFVLGVQESQGLLNSTMQQVMSSAGQTAVKAMERSIKAMPSVAIDSFSKISSSAKSGMSSFTAEVTNGSKKSNIAMQNGMKSMNTVVQSNMRNMQNTSAAGMRSFAASVSNGMITARTNVINECSRMKSATSNLQNGFYQSGYYASLGLANGINAGSGNAVSAAQRLANTISDTMRKALQVHSPSRVTRKIGGFTTEGFVLGLLDNIGRVKSTAGKIIEAAVPTGDIMRRIVYAGNYAMNTSYSYVESTEATYTIVVPVEIEGREVARATVVYTKKELEELERRNNRKKGYR